MKKEIMKAPASPKAKAKVEKVMGEFKRGKLQSSSGQKVKSRDQAIAIALSEARGALKRKYGGSDISMYKDNVGMRFGENMMEDPRKPGAGMRNARRYIYMGDGSKEPKYSEKEEQAMREAEYAKMDKKMRDARKKFYNK